ncbi:MAG: fasciclin domain-containing protein, partial [Candidatus Halalkalibacterium sp. M3_1C_030]
SCKDSDDSTITPIEEPKVLDLIQSNSNLETLAALLEGTSVIQNLSGSGTVTIFAPSDAAFAKLPQGYLQGLTNQQILEILKYHVYSGDYPLINEIKREAIISLHGDPLFLEIGQSFGDLLNGQAKFVSTNKEAKNGLIHIIDVVLLPDQYGTLAENIYKRYDLRRLYERMESTGELATLNEAGSKTLLAPVNSSIEGIDDYFNNAALSTNQWLEIMKHHILNEDISDYGPNTQKALVTTSGDSVFLEVSESGTYKLDNTDIPLDLVTSSNGKILFSPGVMLPDKYLGVLTLMDKRHYLNTARSTLAAAKLTGRLYNSDNNADEKFTIFIPKNDAAGINNLPADENGLANILKYHVLLEKIMADQLQHNQKYTTWQGEEITITRSGDVLTINGTTTITMSDLNGRNGVVHVINGTLTPPAN